MENVFVREWRGRRDYGWCVRGELDVYDIGTTKRSLIGIGEGVIFCFIRLKSWEKLCTIS